MIKWAEQADSGSNRKTVLRTKWKNYNFIIIRTSCKLEGMTITGNLIGKWKYKVRWKVKINLNRLTKLIIPCSWFKRPRLTFYHSLATFFLFLCKTEADTSVCLYYSSEKQAVDWLDIPGRNWEAWPPTSTCTMPNEWMKELKTLIRSLQRYKGEGVAGNEDQPNIDCLCCFFLQHICLTRD